MDNVTIPPEVVEELRHCVRRVTGVEIAPTMAEDLARAMLAAWPKGECIGPDPDSLKGTRWLLLPVPQDTKP